MTTIYLIRHAEAEGNLYRRCHGHYDSYITSNGHRQIEALAKRFEGIHIDEVWSSDLRRTITTSLAIREPKNLPLHTDPRLREMGCGVWEDRTWGWLDQFQPEEIARFYGCDDAWQVEGGESFPILRARTTAALEDIAKANPDRVVAVFSHGMAIRTAVSHFMGVSIRDVKLGENTSVSVLEYEKGEMRVVTVGDASHLTPEISTFARQQKKRKGNPERKLWFRPLDMENESDLYLACRREAWETIHKTAEGYDADGYLIPAREHAAYAAESVLCVMWGNEVAGILQMDFAKEPEAGIGAIPFFYLCPAFRNQGLGVQMLGQVISAYRQLGRTTLRLRCAPDNHIARHFYGSLGFFKTGEAKDTVVPLDLLDRPINQ